MEHNPDITPPSWKVHPCIINSPVVEWGLWQWAQSQKEPAEENPMTEPTEGGVRVEPSLTVRAKTEDRTMEAEPGRWRPRRC